jgi:hypothetical protein
MNLCIEVNKRLLERIVGLYFRGWRKTRRKRSAKALAAIEKLTISRMLAVFAA